MRAGEGPASGLPLVWANPLKFVGSPDRLILLHAIEKKVPFPPEKEKLAGRVGVFGPGQEAVALKRFGTEAKEALARTFEVAERCAFAFEDIVPPLPAGLFPKTLRETVMARLTAAKDLSWKERQRARRELAVDRELGLRAVLPHRPRRRRVRPPPRHPPQPARLRGVVLPGLAPRRLPRQPRRVRPLFRAVPQQGPARPSGHRHRLRLAAARRGHGLRPRAVRPRRDGGGLRLQPEELRGPLRPLRDRPGLRRPARRGARHGQARRRSSPSRIPCGPPRPPRASSTSGSSPPSWTASTPRSRSTSAGSS